MTLGIAILALVLALAALALAVLGRRTPPDLDDSSVPSDLAGLRHEVAGLKLDTAAAFRHLAVVRYDAFADTGGHLSWSIALADDSGSGVVITSIHGRYDTRTYAKGISDWSSDQPLSPEEETAISSARPA